MTDSDTRMRLLGILANGEYHSGARLAAELEISRNAVWKQIHALQDLYGLEVATHRARGYRLLQDIELLDRETINGHLDPGVRDGLGGIHIHPSIDSTNSWLMAQAQELPGASVCLAERQTGGRGRHGRTWVSPFGRNIYLSMLWHYDLPLAQLSGLSLACGVAVARALSAVGVAGHALKWPNDVLWQRRKLAGLLLEIKGEVSGPAQVIVGVGLNTALTEAEAAHIDQAWVALSQIPGLATPGRNRLAAVLVQDLYRAMEEFEGEGLAPFLDDWAAYDLYRGERIRLHLGNRQIGGDYLGIAEDGSLRLQTEEGPRQFNAGEVRFSRVAD